jgi:hypothetical protein
MLLQQTSGGKALLLPSKPSKIFGLVWPSHLIRLYISSTRQYPLHGGPGERRADTGWRFAINTGYSTARANNGW